MTVKLWDLDVITVAQGLVIQMRRSKWISRLHHKPARFHAFGHSLAAMWMHFLLRFYGWIAGLPRVLACRRIIVKVLKVHSWEDPCKTFWQSNWTDPSVILLQRRITIYCSSGDTTHCDVIWRMDSPLSDSNVNICEYGDGLVLKHIATSSLFLARTPRQPCNTSFKVRWPSKHPSSNITCQLCHTFVQTRKLCYHQGSRAHTSAHMWNYSNKRIHKEESQFNAMLWHTLHHIPLHMMHASIKNGSMFTCEGLSNVTNQSVLWEWWKPFDRAYSCPRTCLRLRKCQ